MIDDQYEKALKNIKRERRRQRRKEALLGLLVISLIGVLIMASFEVTVAYLSRLNEMSPTPLK